MAWTRVKIAYHLSALHACSSDHGSVHEISCQSHTFLTVATLLRLGLTFNNCCENLEKGIKLCRGPVQIGIHENLKVYEFKLLE